MWYRHGVDEWHLDCRIETGKHDFIASVLRVHGALKLIIPATEGGTHLERIFKSTDELNRLLKDLGMEILPLDPLVT